MSIIDEKYTGKYRGAGDWFADLVTSNFHMISVRTVKTKAEDGTVTETQVPAKRTELNLDGFIAFARENNIEIKQELVDSGNAGRIRMTLGNALRAAARKRHGLFVEGSWVDAPADFCNPGEPTEARDGTKIAKPKAAETEKTE
jgi:hypothetical protein